MGRETQVAGKSFDYWLAWEYDQRNTDLPNDELAWYTKHARRIEGPILELGCGTGRILIPLAAQGILMHGIDISAEMLRRLSDKAEAEGMEESEYTLFHGDVSNFEFREQYSLVYAPYNSLQYLGTGERILALLRRIYLALDTKAVFLAMTYHRDPKWYDGTTPRRFEKDAIVHPGTGISIRHRVSETLSQDRESILRMTHYTFETSDGETIEHSFGSQVPLLQGDQYQDLIRNAGFKVQTYSGYSEHNLYTQGTLACHVAEKG